ncbi:hypothetical protein [Pedobacter sp. P26]|uniref:hypothetical protein n=1 Tax=Pedobacter sp. P26 TaxID=3423956 RepID=UPI003D67E413
MRSIFLLSAVFSISLSLQAQTLQSVTDLGNTTTNGITINSSLDVGDSYEATRYGMLQITRPASQGTNFHLAFVRKSKMAYGMGFLDNTSTFGLQPWGNNTTKGLFMDINGLVGIGIQVPAYKFDVGGDIRASGRLYVSIDNSTGGGITLSDDGDIVDLNDGWASHRFSYGLSLYSANKGG